MYMVIVHAYIYGNCTCIYIYIYSNCTRRNTWKSPYTAILIMIEGQFQILQQYSSSKLVLKPLKAVSWPSIIMRMAVDTYDEVFWQYHFEEIYIWWGFWQCQYQHWRYIHMVVFISFFGCSVWTSLEEHLLPLSSGRCGPRWRVALVVSLLGFN